MNASVSTSPVPQSAEWCLRIVLAPDKFDCVAGDLLEEYRDRVLPVRGRAAADRWYWRQVSRAVWRFIAAFCLTGVALHVWREAIDELVPTADYHLRSYILSYGMMAVALVGGASGGWRARRIAAGALTAGTASLFGWSGAWATAAALAAVSPAGLLYPGGVGELVSLPFLTLPPMLLLGALGAVVGKCGRSAASGI